MSTCSPALARGAAAWKEPQPCVLPAALPRAPPQRAFPHRNTAKIAVKNLGVMDPGTLAGN